MKKLYVTALLALGLMQGFANTTVAPPDCTLVPIASATATTGNAALAIDGIGGTRWESEATDPQSLTIDLGTLSTISAVTIDWETANAKDYFLRGSADGTTWVDIAAKTNMAPGVRTDVIDGINAQYRWIKMDGVTRNTPYGYSIYEINVCSTAITPPMECNAVTIASATASTGNAALAIDGSLATRWESEQTDPQSITVDLGASTTVHAVTLAWETASAKDYVLRGSVDGTTWVDIATKTDMPTGPRTDVITDIDAAYQWLKMDGVSRNTPYGYSIYEFTVCGEATTPPVDVCTPVPATSATATTGNAALAIDGITTSRWESEFNDAQSLTVNLGAVATVHSVHIMWETANAKDYVLRGSTDGTTWVDIATKTNMPTGERTDIITDINADYQWLRMGGVTRNTPYGYSIYEFTVCGDAGTPVIPYVPIPAVLQAEDYVTMSGVQTGPTADEGGGESVGYIDAGDYMDYNITAPAAGNYTMSFRVASAVDTGVVEALSNGTSLGTVAVPATGGWDTWQTVSLTAALPEGNQTIRIQAAGLTFNLNWIQFETATAAGTQDFNKNKLALYPNPAHGIVNITLSQDSQVTIYNTLGAVVKTQNAQAGAGIVDVSALSAGLYIVKAGTASYKLVIN